MKVSEILKVSKKLKTFAANLSEQEKNNALTLMSQSLIENTELILSENKKDLENYGEGVMADRLRLTKERIKAMAQGILDVAKLNDPVGKILEERTLYNGLNLKKVSVPVGVVAVIYESRPNVTSDAAALLLKSGNVCILRGGKEAFLSSSAIVKALKEGLKKANLPEDLISMPDSTDRSETNLLMTATGYVDLLIPRGGAGLIKACTENATVPCIETGTGICHIYVDEFADIKKALKITENAKMSRPSVCNAAEVCLVHSAVAKEFLPKLKALIGEKCKFILDNRAIKIIDGERAGEEAFDTEYLDYILAIKIVDSVEEACEHISAHSTMHSESIITENEENSKYFTSHIDSAAVYVNASTRFTDGGEFGMGCEIGISTQRLHARGPMGLEAMNTYKYVITGNGEIR
ncbi:MAG: glutamate-5-semialdehyde dehydrogenase [Ruminococcaceae bacterium]|nr:glutamate-5-semialdehyde dehydrogenase [Oscillospiraceae bacterium]